MKMPSISIHINNLCLMRGGKELYRNFSLDVAAGEVLVLLAPSGRGKTTLLDFIGGILPMDDVRVSGDVSFGTHITTVGPRPRISYVFQDGQLINSATVLQNVEFPLVNLFDRETAREQALQYLKYAGLGEKTLSYPYQLSGGERQRVALCRAFAYPSQILLMDEAFQSQDIRIKMQLIRIFREMLDKAERTVLFVTHEIREAVTVSDRILVMDGSPVRILLDTHVPSSGFSSFSEPSLEALKTEQRIVQLLSQQQL